MENTVEFRLNELEKGFAVMDDRYSRIMLELAEIKATLKLLADKPAKRWDGVVTQLVTLAVAAVFGALVGRLK